MDDTNTAPQPQQTGQLTSSPGSRSLVGGGLAAVCFFLPWMQVSCMGQTKTLSGSEIASERGIVWLVLVAALLIVASAMFYRSVGRMHEARNQIILESLVGLGIIALNYFQFTKGINTTEGRLTASMLQFSWQLGAFGTIAGFVLALYDALTMKHVSVIPAGTADRPIGNAVASDVVRAVSSVERSLSGIETEAIAQMRLVGKEAATGLVSSVGGLRSFGNATASWVLAERKTLILAGAGAAVLTAGFLMIRPRPEKDGERVGAAFVKCSDDYKAEVEGVHRRLLEKFSTERPRSRADAFSEIDKAFKPARAFHDRCSSSASELLAKLGGRWSSNPEKASAFQSAIAQVRGTPFGADGSVADEEFASNLPTFAPIRALIERIVPALPTPDRIDQDLIGRTIDSWHFAYLSELLQTTVENSTPMGDSLDLRVKLDMQDANTHAPYSALLIMRYMLLNDTWQLRNVRPLLLTDQPGIDYTVQGKLFPIGRWRLSDHYATFSPDGYWTGQWDDGSTASGEWRIVKGNLVRTRGGGVWQVGRILSFNANEIDLDLGFGSTTRAERVN